MRLIVFLLLLSFPGVIVHELSHYIVALVLGCKPKFGKLTATKTKFDWSVKFRYTELYQQRLIAVASLVSMLIMWYFFMGEWWYWVFFAFGTWPSDSDLEKAFGTEKLELRRIKHDRALQ